MSRPLRRPIVLKAALNLAFTLQEDFLFVQGRKTEVAMAELMQLFLAQWELLQHFWRHVDPTAVLVVALWAAVRCVNVANVASNNAAAGCSSFSPSSTFLPLDSPRLLGSSAFLFRWPK